MTRAAGERGGWGNWGDWAELLRVSALFTVPGDALAGAAAARSGPNRGTALAVCSSLCLYEAGMALNDWADRDIDAVERPGRPLPSGRIAPGAALTAATGLTAAGLLCAAAAGRPALTMATALAGTVWAYDLGLKNTSAGPPAMAAARALDLLLGATASAPAALRSALPPAALLGAHTLAVTTVSRREAVGGSSAAPLGALAVGAAIAWAATRRPAPAAGHRAPLAAANETTTPGGLAAGAATAALATELSRTGPRRGGPARRLARALSAPPSPGQGNRLGRRWVLRRAPAVGAALGSGAGAGRGPVVGGAVGRAPANGWSRSAATTVRAAAPAGTAVPSPAAVVQGATAAVAHELARGKGVRAGRGSPARRFVVALVAGRRAAVAAGTGHGSPPGGLGSRRGGAARRLVTAATGGGPPGGPRAGAGLPLTIASRGGAAERARPSGRAAVAGVGLVGGRAGAALPRSIAVPGTAATVGVATATGRTRSTSRFAAVVGAAPTRSIGTIASPGAAAGRFAAVAGVVLAGGYVATVARPLAHAALNPSPYFLQRAVGSGIRAMIPLQAVLASRAGAHRTAAGLLALMPVARRLSRKVSAT
ncbi:SCO3242 family prenyltransferase [Streptomyces melanosporofaciens]|uniref:4-hydroxybenzoate polyprenyltransferase n=1 Tax=Streptomyces melanosporofaciens TaxID=67327 RepID=A0A1H4VPB2_STRMJ|nr:UbiA family prenyltransferase [Streptomyces melanosporofaciens]SEC82896.1 4-hydroxybenzoate polyprenyltransferase [Streptomyces melanosporofaciens]